MAWPFGQRDAAFWRSVSAASGETDRMNSLPALLSAAVLMGQAAIPSPAKAAPAAGAHPMQCVTIGMTAPDAEANGERFHYIENNCGQDIVIFYCLVSTSDRYPDSAIGDCRWGRQRQTAGYPSALSELGVYSQPAPASPSIAVKISASTLESLNLFPNPYLRATRPRDASIAEIGTDPAATYRIRPRTRFVARGTVASSLLAPRTALVPSICFATEYLSKKCKPDAFAVWKTLGKPLSIGSTLDALQRYGYAVDRSLLDE